MRGGRRKDLRVRTVQRENSPRPPLAPPAVKSNSLTHSGVVSVSGRVTITKDSSGAAGSVGGFWLGNLSEKTQPPFFFFLFFFWPITVWTVTVQTRPETHAGC